MSSGRVARSRMPVREAVSIAGHPAFFYHTRSVSVKLQAERLASDDGLTAVPDLEEVASDSEDEKFIVQVPHPPVVVVQTPEDETVVVDDTDASPGNSKRARGARSGQKRRSGGGSRNRARKTMRIELDKRPSPLAVRPEITRRALDDAQVTVSSMPLPELHEGKSDFIGRQRGRHGAEWMSDTTDVSEQGVPSGCNAAVADLVRDGYLYVSNDSTRAQVFVDKNGVAFAVKVARPSGADWDTTTERVRERFEDLREQLVLRPNGSNVKHTRGDFDRFGCGISFGGGQRRPGPLCEDQKQNDRALLEFTSDPHVKKVARHIAVSFGTWFPEIAAMYTEMERELIAIDGIVKTVLGTLPFAAHTLNLGPQTSCRMHRDFKNLLYGICAVAVFGQFDWTRSAQFIMKEPRVVIELRPGDVIFLPSAIITHGNGPLLAHETRVSWACYTAGGLFRWVAAGHQSVRSLSGSEAAAYKAKSALRLREGWAKFQTLADLKARVYAG